MKAHDRDVVKRMIVQARERKDWEFLAALALDMLDQLAELPTPAHGGKLPERVVGPEDPRCWCGLTWDEHEVPERDFRPRCSRAKEAVQTSGSG